MKPLFHVLTLTALITACSSPLQAQTNTLETAESEEIEQLERSLEQAREAMREAAREMARARRELQRARPGTHDTGRSRIGVILEPTPDGPRVQGVTPGGPASKAGIRRGDLITGLDGKPVPGDDREAINNLARRVGELEPGKPADITLRRDGESMTLEVTPENGPSVWAFRFLDMPTPPDAPEMHKALEHLDNIEGWRSIPAPEAPSPPEMRMFMFHGRTAGLELAENHAGLAPYFGTERGLLVLNIKSRDTDGPVFELEPGDVILSLAGQPLKVTTDFHRILAGLEPGEPVELEIMRAGEQLTLVGEVPEQDDPFIGMHGKKLLRHGPAI